MELDVHLMREGDESWGFELMGGADCRTPLTIAQVVRMSPADVAGLQPGDTVTRVADRLATELTQQQACALVAEAVGSLAFGVTRGLYEPVLDDFEGIYEPERADSDLHSEPTEVSPPRCIDLPELPLSDLYDFRPITESRSLTASPFLAQTKPFRPFSTEPLQVPPLEDPIILNPKFKDDFAEILEGIDLDKVETKYKLPVSEQYDPNYKKKVDGILEKSIERDFKVQETIEKDVETKKEQDVTIVKELRFEEIQLDVDMLNIEQTAIDVVEESIERAVSVTKEIKEAVEEELRASATRDIVEEKKENIELTEEINELKESEVITSEVFKSEETLFKESKEVKNINVAEKNAAVNNVEVVDKPKEILYVRENKNKLKTHEVKTEMSEFVRKDFEETASKVRKESEGKQKAFNIGLQTIPNIKGMAQSSHHFDLLMRTFFIHLTDVMVAMSRFILTQPALELEIKAERVIRDKLITGIEREETNSDFKRQEFQKSEQTDVRKNVEVTREFIEEQKRQVERHSEIKKQEYIDMELEEIESKRLSGAEMAQMTQRKPKELTHRMDAVISEFETKTGIDDRLEVTEKRARSRNRSRIEEEVMNESDPLDWLAKVDSTQSSQEKTSISTSKIAHSESKRSEHESKEVITSKTKPGKQMYVAVVESHVYTNKEAILQEMLETSSIESTEEMNTTEMMKSEKQQAVEVITQALEESNAIVETTEVSLEATKEFTETKVSKQAVESKQELLTSVASETIETVEDLQTKSLKVLEVSEKTAIATTEENYKATAVQSTETLLEESTEEKTETRVSEKHATSKIEQMAIAIAESTAIVMDDSKVETFEAEVSREKTAILKEEESFKTAAIEMTEVALEEAVEQHAEFVIKGHATIRETNNLAVAGIIETKTEEDKVLVPKPAEDEYACLKIIKQEIIDDPSEDITEIIESEVVKKSIEIANFVSEEVSSYKSEKLHLRTDIAQQLVLNQSSSDENNIDTPTPTTLPTPLTDEYVFKLQIPLAKHTGPIIKEDSPEHEDLSIVKKGLVAHIETSVDETIVYDPPLPTPTEDKIEPIYTKPGLNGGRPVYNKPGLKGGASIPNIKKEYIREIERKSSLLASAIDQTIKSIEEYKEEVGIDQEEIIEEVIETVDDEPKPEDELLGFRTVQFAPDNLPKFSTPLNVPTLPEQKTPEPYMNETGQPLGTVQGIIDGLEEAMVDNEIAKELGRPGMTEEKIATLISGEAEMLREAHVMGLSRVLSSHMTKPDDSSVDFNKIKPLMESLKNSQVIAALNEELKKRKEEEKNKDERKWTTFLQKPQRAAPRAKCGYYGYLPQEENEEGPYKVKIVKQPKPKVAPDYKPEDFETGPLPWEQRALTEPAPPPVALEDPILIPEDGPEFLEAVDPLTETEVPDLQDTGIILPPPQPDVPQDTIEPEEAPPEVTEEEVIEKEIIEEKKEETMKGEVEEMAEQLVQNVKGMVDPHAPIQQQLAQMRAQLAALAQLPCVIQQSLEMLTCHLASISQQESRQTICESQVKTESFEEVDLKTNDVENQVQSQENSENDVGHVTIEEVGASELNEDTLQEEVPAAKITLTAEEYAALKREEEIMLEEQMKSEKLKKIQEKIEQESRQLKQRAAPRMGKPKQVFGPQNPEVRPLVLPGGRRWKGPKDVFNDQFIAETLQAQSEIIQGKVMGFESDRLPFDERVNFMKYEKPPISLDHLQHSDVYKAVHGMEPPQRRVDLLTPVVAESDYRERCRSMTPSTRVEEHLDIPQQLQP